MGMRGMTFLAAAALAVAAGTACAQNVDERPAVAKQAQTGWDYEKRVVDIPMRDGVKLHTIILVPKGARDAPILLTRTPYNAEELTGHAASGHLAAILDGYDNADD